MKKVSSPLKAMFTSWKITLILLVHYVILLAAATFVEKAQGTAMAREIIYNNPLFYLLQFLLILNFCATAWQARLWNQRKYGVLLLHISFIVILLGALVTNMFGFEGIVHIREGETVSQMRTTEDQRPLPFPSAWMTLSWFVIPVLTALLLLRVSLPFIRKRENGANTST